MTNNSKLNKFLEKTDHLYKKIAKKYVPCHIFEGKYCVLDNKLFLLGENAQNYIIFNEKVDLAPGVYKKNEFGGLVFFEEIKEEVQKRIRENIFCDFEKCVGNFIFNADHVNFMLKKRYSLDNKKIICTNSTTVFLNKDKIIKEIRSKKLVAQGRLDFIYTNFLGRCNFKAPHFLSFTNDFLEILDSKEKNNVAPHFYEHKNEKMDSYFLREYFKLFYVIGMTNRFFSLEKEKEKFYSNQYWNILYVRP